MIVLHSQHIRLASLAMAFATFASTLTSCQNTQVQNTVETSSVGLGYAKTSVNCAIFRHSPLASADSAGTTLQFVCFYDSAGYLTLGKRQLDSSNWVTQTIDYRAHVEDGHNVASMAVDALGYVHVSYDHHGGPLHYRRSVAPYSLTLSAEMPMVGSLETDVTYPEFHSLPNGTLLFAYRTGMSGQGNMVLNTYNPHSQTWTRLHDVLIDGEGRRSAYWQMTTDSQGALHLSWVWRETPNVETNHDLCYARSLDGGQTWQKSNGGPYTLPIFASTAEIICSIPQCSELINQTCITTDEACNPYIATYWRAHSDTVPQYRLVWFNGQRWQQTKVGHRSMPFSLFGGGTKMIPISRPVVFVTQGRALFVCRDAEVGSRVSLYTAANLNAHPDQWEFQQLTDAPVEAWEPSFDEQLWNSHHLISLFVQRVYQGDGERTISSAEPSPISVLNIKFK